MSTSVTVAPDQWLAELLKESPAESKFSWHNKPIVVMGSGGLGQKTLAGLHRHGIAPVVLADNDTSRWGQTVNGVRIVSVTEAAARFANDARFVISIWGAFSKSLMADHISQLRDLGCKDIVTFGELFRAFPDTFLPHYAIDSRQNLLNQAAAIKEAFGLFTDEDSRREFVSQIDWRLNLGFGVLSDAISHPTYFPRELIALRPDEVFIDCGAFDGDTIRQFLMLSHGRFEKIFAFEADPTNFSALERNCREMGLDQEKVRIVPKAVGSKVERTRISSLGGPSSTVGNGDIEIDATRLDDALANERPTFIKMDIEGSEPEALLGASHLVREQAPLLAISCYHRQDHIWKIPLLINSLRPNYQFYLRPHDWQAWDLVCYALPPSRGSREEHD